jgi:hypothetical protein
MEWYVLKGERKFGPMTIEALRAMAATGQIKAETLLWHTGMAEWSAASTIPGIVSPPPSPSSIVPPSESDIRLASAPEPDVSLTPTARQVAFAAGTVEMPAYLEFATPWRRYWATFFDMLVFSSGVSFVSGMAMPSLFIEGGTFADTAGQQLFAWTTLPLVMILNGIVLGLFGTTPGKALAGIRTSGIRGAKLSVGSAIQRSLQVWWYGLGTGFPIVTLFTLVAAFQNSKRGQLAKWEDSTGARSYVRSNGVGRTCAIAVAVLAVLSALNVMNELVKTDARKSASVSAPSNALGDTNTSSTPATVETSPEVLLQAVATEVNRTSPVTIDDQTRLDGASAGPALTFTYRYTLTQVDVTTVAAEVLAEFEATLRDQLKPNTCEGTALKPMRDLGTTIRYEYADANGLAVASVDFSPYDCML